ncbi:uncharacterized protein MONBRDRAFT_38658 [Monosiga brevicollis MX1]|uniref:Coiled-coil domain-containing protein n=1 Tax=Monosiga brevicollis TaxID=81824 RepID=A9V997_MONBE|nr:uncharacterized protein MONBRDRAFT_38658 [Monosiga brevicollis MX1]EDQ85891.1 predicted protein [Monosiga brevicollis MX1]|eukprot:XP_001749370.1 hypothetical protein [Monosiga brevicollis MX1]
MASGRPEVVGIDDYDQSEQDEELPLSPPLVPAAFQGGCSGREKKNFNQSARHIGRIDARHVRKVVLTEEELAEQYRLQQEEIARQDAEFVERLQEEERQAALLREQEAEAAARHIQESLKIEDSAGSFEPAAPTEADLTNSAATTDAESNLEDEKEQFGFDISVSDEALARELQELEEARAAAQVAQTPYPKATISVAELHHQQKEMAALEQQQRDAVFARSLAE